MKTALLLGIFAAGCVPHEAQRADNALELRRQVDSLRAGEEANQKTIKELENRVFVLEDKLDTAEVARTKSADVEPHLPVVKKAKPSDEDQPIATISPSMQPPAGYDPMVPRADASDDGSASDEDPPAETDRIPVVPLPKSEDGDDAAAMTVYKDAYAAVQRRDHDAAIQGFTRFLAQYPHHEYADNAQYWLGETYYDKADFKTALAEFRKVIKQYPAGNKVPDSLLKIGFCYGKLGDPVAAKDVLSQVVQIYGKSDAAKLAQKRLGEMENK